MRPTTIHLKLIGCCMLVLLILAAGITPTRANAASNAGDSQDRYVTIDFNNVDINVFIKFISELTGKNFIVDQRVRGNVTIISPTKISVAEAYKVFESVLEVNGFSTVQAGKATKILPSPEARTSDIPTRTSTKPVTPQDQLVTQLIPLTYANADEIKRLFTPMVSKTSLIVAYAPTNTLIVTDVLSNIQRLIKILKEIDVADVGRQISVIPLQHADSTKMVETLTALFLTRGATKQRATASRDDTKFVADERTNTVIVLASEVEMARVRQLIDFIDRETPRGKEKIRVYYLEYANAEDIAKVLQNLPSKEGTSVKEKGAAGAAGAPLLSGKVNITADKATNSLVITASSDDYTVVEEVIKRLDIPRPMVYIEAVVMEVNAQKDFSLGTEWTAAGSTNYRRQTRRRGRRFFDTDIGHSGLDSGRTAAGVLIRCLYRSDRYCGNKVQQPDRPGAGVQAGQGRQYPADAADSDHRKRGSQNQRRPEHPIPDAIIHHRQSNLQLFRIPRCRHDFKNHAAHQHREARPAHHRPRGQRPGIDDGFPPHHAQAHDRHHRYRGRQEHHRHRRTD